MKRKGESLMKLASIFTDHMVLQANMPIRVFGTGRGKVEVRINGESQFLNAESENWCVTLPAMEYGGPYSMEVKMDGKITLIKDIYMGEVWLACGQSNMEMPLFRTEYGMEEAEHAANDKIRFFNVPKRFQRERPISLQAFYKLKSVDTPWQICNERSSLYFSAIGYYVAKELQKKLGIAIGMISCNWGGTPIEAHIDRKYFYDRASMKEMIASYDQMKSKINWQKYEELLKQEALEMDQRMSVIDYDEVEYVKQVGVRAAAEHNKKEIPPQTIFPGGIYRMNQPGCLYDSMYSRILPFGVRGMLWYQGESNRWEGYLEKYLAFMQCMRAAFQNEEMPFYAIELASFSHPDGGVEAQICDDRFVTKDIPCNWAYNREQQQRATKVGKNNYLVTSMELGDAMNIHPIHKKELAHRLALKMLKHTYHFDVMADQPVYKEAIFEENQIRIILEHAQGLFCPNLKHVKMFVADESHILKRAEIEIEGEELLVRSKEVEKPILVRYGFDFYYDGMHIYNEAGLPLAPFRTDTE